MQCKDAQIILVGHRKGGVGKSTVATNLAVALALRGKDVLLVDADSQATSTQWAAERAESSAIRVPCVQASGDLRPTLADLQRRYDALVIDVSGRDSMELRTAVLTANILVAPTRPSQADLWELGKLAEMVIDCRTINEGLRPVAVINQAPHNTGEGRQARALFADFPVFDLAETVLCERKAFRTAMMAGAGVLEGMDDRAAGEMAALGVELFGAADEMAAPMAWTTAGRSANA